MKIQDRLNNIADVWSYDSPNAMVANLMKQAADRVQELEDVLESLIDNELVSETTAKWLDENGLLPVKPLPKFTFEYTEPWIPTAEQIAMSRGAGYWQYEGDDGQVTVSSSLRELSKIVPRGAMMKFVPEDE